MKSSPYISIYLENKKDEAWFGETLENATLIFSKNVSPNKYFARKRLNIWLSNRSHIDTQGSIKSIWIINTFDTSTELPELEKIEKLLYIIYQSFLTIAQIEGLDTDTYEKAYQLSLADKGKFVWYSDLKSNKIKSLKARIKITLEKDKKVPVVAQFFDKSGNLITEILIIETFSMYINWDRVFDYPVWIDNEKFGYRFLNEELLLYANFKTGLGETIIAQDKVELEELQGRLRGLTFRTFANEKEYAQWTNQ